MSEVLIKKYRGGILENIHSGHICIVDRKFNVVHSVGNPEQLTFYRSVSKPLQALPVIMHGLDIKYGLTSQEIAIMSGSHSAEDIHVEVLESMLKKTDIKEEDFIMNPVYRDKRQPPRKIYHNCAGKHIALMLIARELGSDHKDYWRIDDPAQTEILQLISNLSDCTVEEVGIGIDGCGVPVFAVPLKGIAIAYLKLVCPHIIIENELKSAIRTMTSSISRNPLMIGGTGRLCALLNSDENIIAKAGARGVYGFALKNECLGISLKVNDGSNEIWPIIIAGILEQLNYNNHKTIDSLYKMHPRDILNDNKLVVGETHIIFDLNHSE